jgi:hypothetical protein
MLSSQEYHLIIWDVHISAINVYNVNLNLQKQHKKHYMQILHTSLGTTILVQKQLRQYIKPT